MNILQRMSAKTPKFYRILRNIALALGAAGGVLAAAPAGLERVLKIEVKHQVKHFHICFAFWLIVLLWLNL